MSPDMTQACVEDIGEPIDEVVDFLQHKSDQVPDNELNEYLRYIRILNDYIKETNK